MLERKSETKNISNSIEEMKASEQENIEKYEKDNK